MPPLAHLQYSDKKHWVDTKYARRNRHTHDLPSSLGSIAEIECIREGIQMAVESHGPLNCKIGKYPIPRGEWTGIPQEAVNKTPNTHFFPGHVEVIKPKIVIGL